MSIANVPYVDPTRRSDGVQAAGLAWLPAGVLDLWGWAKGEINYGYTYEVYAGPQSWADGSVPVVKSQRMMDPARLRNLLRSIKPEFLAVLRAIESGAAEEIGGVPVVDPDPSWLDDPLEPVADPDPS